MVHLQAELNVEFVDSLNGTVIDAFTIGKPTTADSLLNTPEPQNIHYEPPLHRDGL